MTEMIVDSVTESKRRRPWRIIWIAGLAAVAAVVGVLVVVVSHRKIPTYQADVLSDRGYVDAMAFSPDGKILAVGEADKTDGPPGIRNADQGGLSLWDVAGRRSVATLTLDRRLSYRLRSIESVAFSPDGKTLAASGIARKADGAVEEGVWLWDMANRQNIATSSLDHRLPFRHGHVQSVAFSPDGKTLAIGGCNTGAANFPTGGGTWLWDLAGQRNLGTLTAADRCVEYVAFSHNGTTLVSTEGGVISSDSRAQLWDTASRRLITTVAPGGNGHRIFSSAFSPDGKTLAVGGRIHVTEGGLWLWDVTRHRKITALPVPDVIVSSLMFSPDGKTLAVGALYTKPADNTSKGGVWLWDASSHRKIAALTLDRGRFVKSVAFSPDGKTLAIGGEGIGLGRAREK
ncbi:hypothetical protein AB0L00_07885 [Actinoallomurus sp. NPDC052308]|uniref:WD40 repeat domain-containing protein n=1 Tax=Actinoallomurus sp. NPDC052308 TaxID=3155530 RepID=UPI0034173132